MNIFKMRRGDIFYADFDPVVGSEQGGKRPALIVQNDIGNKYSPTIIVVPLTQQPKKDLPTHVAIPKSNGLCGDSFILTEQLRTLDRSRVSKYIGHISGEIMYKVNNALSVSVGLSDWQSPKGEMLLYNLCPNCEIDFTDGDII